VIVDAHQRHFHGSGWAAIAAAGLAGLCSLVEERSQIALPRLLADGFVADAAWDLDRQVPAAGHGGHRAAAV
jgi:hypothetical protein